MRDKKKRLKIIYYYVSFCLPLNFTHETITTTIHTQTLFHSCNNKLGDDDEVEVEVEVEVKDENENDY